MDLFLFTTDLDQARESFEGGISGFVVDWELRGKHRRQRGWDTEINRDTPEDLERLRSLDSARRICRINGFGDTTPDEVETAIEKGATDLLLPMVKEPSEVDAYLRLVDGRVRAGILVETREACDCAREIATLPIDLVYLGLNDLAISRGTPSLFAPLADGLAYELRGLFEKVPFGMGGLTVVDGGRPLPSLVLMSELSRHRCDFTFLRRSYRRDIEGRHPGEEVARIESAWKALETRDADTVRTDHRRFLSAHAAIERRR
jgi:hypothetical protein